MMTSALKKSLGLACVLAVLSGCASNSSQEDANANEDVTSGAETLLNTVEVQVVLRDTSTFSRRELAKHVEREVLVDVTTQTEDCTPRAVLVSTYTRTALNVTV